MLTFSSRTRSDIWPIKDVPADELEELLTTCRDLFQATYLGILAIPDMLECNEPLARTYLEVQKLAVDSFSMFEDYVRKVCKLSPARRDFVQQLTRPFIQQDVEESQNRRR